MTGEAEADPQDADLLARQIVDSVHEGVVVYGPDLRIRWWNPHMERLSGLAADQVLARHPAEVLPADQGAANLDRVAAALRGEVPPRTEVALRAPTGDTRWYSEATTPLYAASGAIVGALTTLRDITERREAEVTVRASEAKYRLLFDQASDGIALMAVADGSLQVNDAFAAMHGYRPEEMRGLALGDLDTPEAARLAPERLRRLLAGEAMTFEVEHRHRHGHTFPLQVSARVVRMDGQSYFLGFHQDISERHQAERRLRESEDLLDMAFNLNPDVAVITRLRDHRVLRVSAGVHTFFGFKPEEIVGRTTLEAGLWAHPQDRDEMLRQLSAKGFCRELRALLRRKDGICFPGLLSGQVFVYDGEPHLVTTVRDITQRVRSEQSAAADLAVQRLRNEMLLIEEDAQWDRLVAALARELRALVAFDGCSVNYLRGDDSRLAYAVSADGHVRAYTHWEAHPALRRAVATGQPVVRSRADDTDFDAKLGAAVQWVLDVPFMGGTLAINRCDDTPFTADDVSLVARFAPAMAEGYRRVEDLRERRRLAAELEQQRVHAIQADRLHALGEMASGIAHELNQPLNGIRAFAEGVLLAPRLGWTPTLDETCEVLRDIVVQVDRITEIIDHVRFFARADASREASEFPVTDAISGALKLMTSQLRVHGIAVVQQVSADVPLCRGWATQLEQVVLNLLSNARDALGVRAERQRRGDPGVATTWRPQVTIAVSGAIADRVCVSVADNGDGVAPEAAARIFEAFYTTKPPGKGTGLGLAIVRSIVDRHRGAIEVDNRPGEGVTFTVVLPAADPAGGVRSGD